MVQKSYALMKIKLIPRMKYLLGLRDNGRADSGEAGRHKKKVSTFAISNGAELLAGSEQKI